MLNVSILLTDRRYIHTYTCHFQACGPEQRCRLYYSGSMTWETEVSGSGPGLNQGFHCRTADMHHTPLVSLNKAPGSAAGFKGRPIRARLAVHVNVTDIASVTCVRQSVGCGPVVCGSSDGFVCSRVVRDQPIGTRLPPPHHYAGVGGDAEL